MKMSKPLPLPVWDRKAGKRVDEFLDDSPQTYESRPRRSLYQWLESHPLYDWLLAAYQNTKWSARQIEPFIRKHQIDMAEFKPVLYRSFAEFFDREFRLGARPFAIDRDEMGAFAEARYFGWERLNSSQAFPVKGHSLSAEHILGSAKRAEPFVGGPVILARLSPVDYHHVHYPIAGRTLEHHRLGHRLWTVNWNALRNQPDILFKNERLISILETGRFGKFAFVEVGALSVGRIVQVHPFDAPFAPGDEKSVFRFGGSAVVVFGEPASWKPSADLLQHTAEGMETLVRLGEPIGLRAYHLEPEERVIKSRTLKNKIDDSSAAADAISDNNDNVILQHSIHYPQHNADCKD
jgi:phosphatidylserine decarboxylase